ncbi:Trm112 family protein [Sphaerisporangium rufum]|uniref:Trm112 family protein n=1 Tax=Sphaerisporangium rufum TaxID=1381558 RepID=UPI0023B2227F
MTVKIDDWLLDILACPACRSPLTEVAGQDELACTSESCGLVYPVRDDIPVLLVDEARKA